VTLPLTEKQEKLWRFIASCPRSPSYEEMREHMKLYGKSGVHRLLQQLKERGCVDYTPGKARTVVALCPRTVLARIPTETLQAELARRLAA